MVISYKISDETKKKMIEHYKYTKREKTPAYAHFQADDADTVITLYESNKVVFQGVSADIDARIWKETEKNLTGHDVIEKKPKEKKEQVKTYKYYSASTIGSDETGTGDYFGPVVVCATFVKKEDISFLEELGVKDSKKITDDIILNIAPKLIERLPHKIEILSNTEYNKWQRSGMNMNKIKATLHNRVLEAMTREISNYEYMVIDQFAEKYVYYSYLKDVQNVVRNIIFLTKAEDQVLSVAAASIISRYTFLSELDKMGKQLGVFIPKGASSLVDEFGKKLVSTHGVEILKKCAKYNFKNTEKILND